MYSFLIRGFVGLCIIGFAGLAIAQTFNFIYSSNSNTTEGATFQFCYRSPQCLPQKAAKDAPGYQFLKSDESLFITLDNKTQDIPSLFPHSFKEIVDPNHPIISITQVNINLFRLYEIANYIVAIDRRYPLYSAIARGVSSIWFVTREEGTFKEIEPDHIFVYSKAGEQLEYSLKPISKSQLNIMVDRSGSMEGSLVDHSIATALKSFSQSKHLKEITCGISEFADVNQVVIPASSESCSKVLQNYQLGPAQGRTALHAALYANFKLASQTPDTLHALLAITDGEATDESSEAVDQYARTRKWPVFTLFAGDDINQGYLTPYSTAEFHSQAASQEDIKKFLSAIAWAVKSHQSVEITPQ